SGICQTKECLDLAQRMQASINTTVDPCDDFYAHSCDGWIGNTTLPDDQSSWTRFKELHKTNMGMLNDILAREVEPELSTEPGEAEVDKANLEQLRSMYSACMDTDTIDALGGTPIHPLFTLVRSYFSPGMDRVPSANLSSLMGRLLARGITTLLSVQVNPDIHSPKDNLIRMGQAGISFTSTGAYHTKSVSLHYPTHIRQVLSLVLEKGIRRKFGTEDLTRIAQSIWEFESKLAAIFSSSSWIADPVKSYNMYSLGNISTLITAMDVSQVLSSMIALGNDTRIQLSSPAYMQGLHRLLTGTSAETVQWYFLWKVAIFAAPHLSSDISSLYQDIQGLVTGITGLVDPSQRWEMCVDYVEQAAGFSLGRYFVQATFTESTKEMALSIVRGIKDEFEDRAKVLPWLDDTTREALLTKSRAIEVKVGYPVDPDVKSPSSLAGWYDGARATNKDHVGNMLSFESLKTCKTLGKIGQPVHQGRWNDFPSTVNAYYSRHHNEIVFPSGILQAPFFSDLLPDYINYGSMGMFVGHELSHAFDVQGRKYDAEGALKDWWTPQTATTFSNKTQCFVDQLKQQQSFLFPPWVGNLTEKTGSPFDPTLMMSEVLADNSGLRQAERAWGHRLGKAEPGRNVMLPDAVAGATPKKLFYYAYAQDFCQQIRPDKLSSNLQTDPHPPMRLRVLGALQNSGGFSAAFQCPLGSPMNPKDKCQLW
ncbi:hypothetical protein BJ684DRAFT_11994, partial [Piptocephalis cylindrospora]